MRNLALLTVWALPLWGAGCVMSGTHQAVVDALTKTRTALADTRTELDKLTGASSGPARTEG